MSNELVEIKKNMEDLHDVATLFYQGKNEKGFSLMNEATDRMLNVVNKIVELTQQHQNTNGVDLNFVNAALTEILNAYECKDGILIADLLTFELLDHLEWVLNQWRQNKGWNQ